jgi:hypothetical protein
MVTDKGELYVQLDNLLSNQELAKSMGERAFRVIEVNSGAAKKTIGAIGGLIVAR